MQGYPLAMVDHSIIVVLMIKQMKAEYSDVTHTWYADDACALGAFNNIVLYSNSLKHFGLGHGYYTKPSKSVLIVHPNNLTAGVKKLRHGFKNLAGACYLGGLIGYDKYKREWLKDQILTWEINMRAINKTVGKYPQESYVGVVFVIKFEWIFWNV